jgi:hypothetical protein
MTEPRVTMAHIRQAKLCARGARAFFERYQLDWPGFLREGIPACELEATGDALVTRVCAIAREEVPHGRQQ